MESTLYGIYALVVFVSEILLVRCAHSFDFWYVNNSCVNTVRQHFPCSILYAFASLKLYVSKLNPSCPAFFQKPKARFTTEDIVWYENSPLGVNKLGDMMKIISKGANLSQVYTNHSVRASAITVLSDANVPDRHIMFVSGHSSEQSISHYSARPSAPQLESVSDTISNALQYNQTQSTQISTVSSTPSVTPLIESSNRMASSVSMSSASASFPSGFFNNCNIQGGVQVLFGLQSRSDEQNWLDFSSIL